MTIITPLQNTAAANVSTTNAKATISADFDTFLKMLTTQMQNQDPLNPMESTEFATQLATFSGVEQQVKTNDHLAALAGQLGLASMAQLAGWIGMEARSSASAQFNGSPLTLHVTPETSADTARLIVTDLSGKEVQNIPVSVPISEVVWAGVTDTGTPLPNGAFNFHLASYGKDGALLGKSAAEHYAQVTEARADAAGAVQLVLTGGSQIAASEVRSLRRP